MLSRHPASSLRQLPAVLARRPCYFAFLIVLASLLRPTVTLCENSLFESAVILVGSSTLEFLDAQLLFSIFLSRFVSKVDTLVNF